MLYIELVKGLHELQLLTEVKACQRKKTAYAEFLSKDMFKIPQLDESSQGSILL